MPDTQCVNYRPFVIQCKICNTILADSFSIWIIKKEFMIFKEKSDDIRLIKNNTVIFNLDDCLIDHLECRCGLIVGAFIKSASKEFNGCSGSFLFATAVISQYQLGRSTIEHRTILEIDEDVKKIKYIISKLNL